MLKFTYYYQNDFLLILSYLWFIKSYWVTTETLFDIYHNVLLSILFHRMYIINHNNVSVSNFHRWLSLKMKTHFKFIQLCHGKIIFKNLFYNTHTVNNHFFSNRHPKSPSFAILRIIFLIISSGVFSLYS